MDMANLFFRAKHIASFNADAWEKVGMALHLSFNAINKVVKKFNVDHVVFAIEGRSWRKDVYQPYKQTRKDAKAAKTEEEREEDQMFFDTLNAFIEYLTNKTNCSVIRAPNGEADDVIARFIHLHPHDDHIIISTDTDFLQLQAPNVRQYNGVNDEIISLDGYFDAKGNAVIDKKTKEPKVLKDPKYILFEKCIRGDTSDNIFSAYPGVRTKGTKNKTGLLEAYGDMVDRGFAWNNFMNQTWKDHNEVTHLVKDDYERNRLLIDLAAQPPEIKSSIDMAIRTQLKTTPIPQVGIHFLKFCSKYELNKITEFPDSYVQWLKAPYRGSVALGGMR